jgi:hypothetical protein
VSAGDPASPQATADGTDTGGTTAQTGGQVVNGVPVAAPAGLGGGAQVGLMALASALLIGIGLVPPLIGQRSSRRRRRGPAPYDPPEYR